MRLNAALWRYRILGHKYLQLWVMQVQRRLNSLRTIYNGLPWWNMTTRLGECYKVTLFRSDLSSTIKRLKFFIFYFFLFRKSIVSLRVAANSYAPMRDSHAISAVRKCRLTSHIKKIPMLRNRTCQHFIA